MTAWTCWFVSYVSLINNFHKHFVIVSSVCDSLIICLIMINSHISFTLRHVLSVLLCDVSPYPLICMTHCSSCVMCRFPYCLRTPYPEALDRYDFSLRFRTSAPLVNSPCESLSDHVVCFRPCKASTSPLSSVVLCTFFCFSPHFLLTYLSESRRSEKPGASITTERRSWLCTKEKKTVLDQTMHSVKISVSSSWDVASVDLCSSALVTSSDQRTPSRALQTEEHKTSTSHLQQEDHKSAPLFSAGFGPHLRSWTLQAPQSAKRDFHDAFTNPFQKLSLRENTDNTSTNICSTIRCKIQSCLESQDNPKATQQTFYQFAPDQHFDNQRINIFSTVRD